MKITIEGPQKDNELNMMRSIGYLPYHDSFIRPLSRIGYPRFHIYIETKNEDLIINIHLDQKKPSYKGTYAHSGEYDGELVEEEVKRIEQILNYL